LASPARTAICPKRQNAEMSRSLVALEAMV
jgi:hypothetical protein